MVKLWEIFSYSWYPEIQPILILLPIFPKTPDFPQLLFCSVASNQFQLTYSCSLHNFSSNFHAVYYSMPLYKTFACFCITKGYSSREKFLAPFRVTLSLFCQFYQCLEMTRCQAYTSGSIRNLQTAYSLIQRLLAPHHNRHSVEGRVALWKSCQNGNDKQEPINCCQRCCEDKLLATVKHLKA